MRRHVALLLAVALGFALSAMGAIVAAPATSAAAKKAKCVRARVGGRSVCLKLGARCDPNRRFAYLRAGLDCVTRRGKRVLVKASPAALRGGRYVALPPSGYPTLAQALAAFDTTVADLPGVPNVPGLIGASDSGTTAIGWLYDYRDRLTPAQLAVLYQVLTIPPDSQTVNIDADGNVIDDAGPPPAAASQRRARAAAVDRYTQIVREAVPKLQAHGVIVNHPVVVGLQPTDHPNGDQANAWPNWLAPHPPLGNTVMPPNADNACEVNVYPKAQAVSLAYMRQILAHELTHCAQYGFVSSIGQWATVPQWVSDGTAEYVAYTVSQEWNGSVTSTGWWGKWLRQPQFSLFTRSYDAVGFWSLLAQLGANVFGLIGPLVQAGGQDGAYRVAEAAVDDSYRYDWGSTLAMVAPLGPLWNLNGPGVERPKLPVSSIQSDGPAWTAEYAAKGAAVQGLDLSADILTITNTPTAKGRLQDASGVDHQLAPKMDFCLRDGGCACPGKPDQYPQKLPQGAAFLGVADVGGAGYVTVAGRSLDEECKKDKTPPTSGGGGGGAGTSGPGLEVRGLTEGSPLLGRITSCSGTFTGTAFVAKGTGSGYRFEMRIAGALRQGAFEIPNNDSKSYVKLRTSGKTYSTLGRNTEVLGTTGPRVAGFAVIRTVRVKVGNRTVTRYRITAGIDDLVSGGKPGVALIPGRGGLLC